MTPVRTATLQELAFEAAARYTAANPLSRAGFGNWLRLAGPVTGGPDDGSAAVVVDIYWVLTE